MLAGLGLSAEKIAIDLLGAVRLARTASGPLIEHATSMAELAQLACNQEIADLKKFLLGMQLLAVLIGLTLLHAAMLAVVIAWDTPYRLHVVALMPVIFAVASYLVWHFLGQFSRQRENHLAVFSAEVGKTLHLLRNPQ